MEEPFVHAHMYKWVNKTTQPKGKFNAISFQFQLKQLPDKSIRKQRHELIKQRHGLIQRLWAQISANGDNAR